MTKATGLRPLAPTIALLALFAAPGALAQDATGTWTVEGGEARIRIQNCPEGLCGAIAWLREPNDLASGRPKLDVNNPDPARRTRPLIGLQIISMKPDGANRWKGTIYNAESGKTYTSYISVLGPQAIQLEGCVLGGMICGKQTWARATEPTSAPAARTGAPAPPRP